MAWDVVGSEAIAIDCTGGSKKVALSRLLRIGTLTLVENTGAAVAAPAVWNLILVMGYKTIRKLK